MKCIIILSSKSAGSSACQSLLSRLANVRCVAHTRHFENETLYWTKAASILGMPQAQMLDSEVPIPTDKARQDLLRLLSENLDNYSPPSNDRQMIFEGWHRLCETYAPIFLEKSPHHLFQWSALELIYECVTTLTDIEFFFVGLVRNPMDVLYSAYNRWKIVPEKFQHEWMISYQNLLRFEKLIGNRIAIVRYEDMVQDLRYLHPLFGFMGREIEESAPRDFLHNRSISRWRSDRFYGFSLAPEVHALAGSFGYDNSALDNSSYAFWPLQRNLTRTAFKLISPVETLIAKLIR